MSSFARNTQVTEARSRDEIERLLMRYGADEFGYVTRATEAIVGFVYRGVRVQMTIPLPDRDAAEFTRTPSRGTTRTNSQAFKAWDAEKRRRWRSLCAVIKALLIGVDDGVLTFEEAFMPYIRWGNGLTTSQMLLPKILAAIEDGHMPTNLKQLELLPST